MISISREKLENVLSINETLNSHFKFRHLFFRDKSRDQALKSFENILIRNMSCSILRSSCVSIFSFVENY